MAAKYILLFGILHAVVAKPSIDDFPDPNCIRMTEENETKLNSMIQELVDFLGHLSVRYDEFDMLSLKINIDKHSDRENDKDTILDITVNNCDASKDAELTNVEEPIEDKMEIGDDVKPSVMVLELPKNGEELLDYMKKKRGTKPFVMYANGYKQILFF